MFDKLIESEPASADFKNRRTYFIVSTAAVSVLFTVAVVISIYAVEISLGTDSFELSQILAVAEPIAEPEIQKPQSSAASVQPISKPPSRTIQMSSVNEPTIVPATTAVVPNTSLSRPTGPVEIGPADTNPTGTAPGGTGNNSGPVSAIVTETVRQPEPEPPPVKKDPPAVPRTPPTQSLGVINGRATHLPKPLYSATAVAMHASGKVDVQVSIDETGRVVSANAKSGHPLLRDPAEQAARKAKFSPTYLSNVPVKVTGVIVYNFTK